MFITETGMIVRSSIDSLSPMGRATQGVKLVNLKGDDQLVSVDVISERDLEKFGSDKPEGDGEEGEAPTAQTDAPAADAEPTEEPDGDAPDDDEESKE